MVEPLGLNERGRNCQNERNPQVSIDIFAS